MKTSTTLTTQRIFADLPRLVDEARNEPGLQPSPAVGRYVESLDVPKNGQTAIALDRAVRRLAAGDPARVGAAIEAVAALCDGADAPAYVLDVILRVARAEPARRADQRLGSRALEGWSAAERGTVDERAAARLLARLLLVAGPVGAERLAPGYACELVGGVVPVVFGAASPATAAAVIDRLHGIVAVV